MKLFNGSKKLKDELIKEIKAHQEADRYIQECWYDENTGKGGHYGCIMKTHDDPREKFAEKYNFDLCYVFLTERLFEWLPKGEFENYPLTSIEVFLKDGKLPKTVNWNKIKSEFYYKLLDNHLKYCKDDKYVTDYLKCRDLFKVPFDEIDGQEASNLSGAARDASRATHFVYAYAAAAAYYSADAVGANAYAAAAAYYSADAVGANAYAAAAVYDSTVYDATVTRNHYIWMRDLLFKCVKNNITF